MNHFNWKVAPVAAGRDTQTFAADMENALNALENEHFEVYDIMRAPSTPDGREGGYVAVGRKPARW